jgi:hypothetical protein
VPDAKWIAVGWYILASQSELLTSGLPRESWKASARVSHSRCRPQAHRLNAAGFSFAVVGRGELLLPFKAVLLAERACGLKSGRPPLLAPSFNVEGDIAHDSNAPGLRSPPV